MSEFPGIEVTHQRGLRDFGQEIEKELGHLVPAHDRELPENIEAGLSHDLPVVTVRDESPTKARYRTVVLNANDAEEITGPYPDRSSSVITCQGPGTAYVGADNQIRAAVPGPVVAIPAGASRTFTHADRIFVIASAAGTVVDIVEERYR